MARPTTHNRCSCPGGGIGRRTSFRCWRSQGRGGSSPLLGTIASDGTETLGKLSSGRSPKRPCYGNLLRFRATVEQRNLTKTARNHSADCYGILLRDLPRGVFVRAGRFYYRRTLPIEVQRLTGRLEVWRSLRTDSRRTAMRRLPAVIAEVELRIEIARNGHGLSVDTTLIRPFFDNLPRAATIGHVSDNALRSEIAPLRLGDAYSRYLDDPTHSWSASTRQAYETTRDLVVRTLGSDRLIHQLNRQHVRELVNVLRFLPRNSAKLFPSLSPRAAAERARSDPALQRISTANANAYLGNFSTFLNWAVGEEIINRNPARGLRLPDEVARRDKRYPFSPSQMRLMFNAPLYTGCADGERCWSEPGALLPKNARFWVPLIALHSGMRLNEICQLDVTDIRDIDGILCFCLAGRVTCGANVGLSGLLLATFLRSGFRPSSIPSSSGARFQQARSLGKLWVATEVGLRLRIPHLLPRLHYLSASPAQRSTNPFISVADDPQILRIPTGAFEPFRNRMQWNASGQ